jgi:hypothetical protein
MPQDMPWDPMKNYASMWRNTEHFMSLWRRSWLPVSFAAPKRPLPPGQPALVGQLTLRGLDLAL